MFWVAPSSNTLRKQIGGSPYVVLDDESARDVPNRFPDAATIFRPDDVFQKNPIRFGSMNEVVIPSPFTAMHVAMYVILKGDIRDPVEHMSLWQRLAILRDVDRELAVHSATDRHTKAINAIWTFLRSLQGYPSTECRKVKYGLLLVSGQLVDALHDGHGDGRGNEEAERKIREALAEDARLNAGSWQQLFGPVIARHSDSPFVASMLRLPPDPSRPGWIPPRAKAVNWFNPLTGRITITFAGDVPGEQIWQVAGCLLEEWDGVECHGNKLVTLPCREGLADHLKIARRVQEILERPDQHAAQEVVGASAAAL